MSLSPKKTFDDLMNKRSYINRKQVFLEEYLPAFTEEITRLNAFIRDNKKDDSISQKQYQHVTEYAKKRASLILKTAVEAVPRH